MRAWVYARTSGEEKNTGQDIKSQASAVQHDAENRGWVVEGQALDDGVSGDTDPTSRKGFQGAISAVQGGLADAIVIAEISRFSRQHPIQALLAWEQVAASGVPVVSIRDSHFNGAEDPDGDKEAVLMRFVTFWSSWGERITIKERTKLAMREIKSGRRKTKSGNPPGRPCKVSRDEAAKAFAWMSEEGLSRAAAARRLSMQRGAFDALDSRTIKKRRVGASTLSGAIERYNITSENPKGTETISDQVNSDYDGQGSVSDGEVGA